MLSAKIILHSFAVLWNPSLKIRHNWFTVTNFSSIKGCLCQPSSHWVTILFFWQDSYTYYYSVILICISRWVASFEVSQTYTDLNKDINLLTLATHFSFNASSTKACVPSAPPSLNSQRLHSINKTSSYVSKAVVFRRKSTLRVQNSELNKNSNSSDNNKPLIKTLLHSTIKLFMYASKLGIPTEVFHN